MWRGSPFVKPVALPFGRRCQPQRRLYRVVPGLSQALRSNRAESIDRRQKVPNISWRDCIAVHVAVEAGRKSGRRARRSSRKKRRKEEEEGKQRGCRGVAASCNESHKRKRSHVILNEGPLRASPSVLTEPPPLLGAPLAVLLVIISPSPTLFIGVSLPFLSPRLPLGVPPLYSFPLPPPSLPGCLVGSDLCLSLSLLVWFAARGSAP